MSQKQETQLKEITNSYFLCKNQFSIRRFASSPIDYENPFYIFYRDVEIVLSMLDKDEKLIIENEYFTHADPSWWKPLFNLKTYLSKKDQAISNFVRLFHEIH